MIVPVLWRPCWRWPTECDVSILGCLFFLQGSAKGICPQLTGIFGDNTIEQEDEEALEGVEDCEEELKGKARFKTVKAPNIQVSPKSIMTPPILNRSLIVVERLDMSFGTLLIFCAVCLISTEITDNKDHSIEDDNGKYWSKESTKENTNFSNEAAEEGER